MTAEYTESRVERVLFPAVCFYLGLVCAVWAAVVFRMIGVTPGTVAFRVIALTQILWAAWLGRRSAVLLLIAVVTTTIPLLLFALGFAAAWPNPGRRLFGLMLFVEVAWWCGPVTIVVARAIRDVVTTECIGATTGWPQLLAASIVFVLGILAVLSLGPH